MKVNERDFFIKYPLKNMFISYVFLSIVTACGEQKIVSNGNISNTTPSADDPSASATPSPTPAATALTYDDVKGIIDTNCSACHGGYASTATNASQTVTADRATMAAEIEAGKMPRGNATFATTANGKKLLSWLKQ